MAGAAHIDVLQQDRGLRSSFAVANILEDWSDPFIKHHGIETLEDYVYLMPKDTWDTHLHKLVDAVPALRDKPVILARFKAAYESGLQAIRQAGAPASKLSTEAMDKLLPESTLTTVARDFKSKYGIDIDPALEPSDTLRSRIYREVATLVQSQ